MDIREITDDRRRYMPLLLIGDEQEDMVCRYIDDGKLYVASVCGVDIAVCLVTDYSPETVEIKDIAVIPSRQRMGYGREFLYWIHHRYGGRKIIVGTGEVPSTLDFYRSCGYTYSHRIPNFFTDNYDHPIIEDGMALNDMVYLTRTAEHSHK